MRSERVYSLMPGPGTTLAGKYSIERVVGEGATAVVYEATHLRLRQRVAIKMLVPKLAEIPEVVHRFEREARALVQLRGPNVAHVFDVDTSADGLSYIVMELLEGHDLAREIEERKGPFPIDEAVGYVLQACTAMADAHDLGIVHRDLKPANLVLVGEPPGRVLKVVDFGLSRLMEGDTSVTETAVVLGTPVYMAPEQAEASKRVDARADIWSLGVILYELLACELPFDGSGRRGVIEAVLSDAPKPLRPRRPEAPEELVAAVMRALTKEPDARYQHVRELAEAIAPFGPAAGTSGASAAPVRRGDVPAPRPSPGAAAAPREPPAPVAESGVVTAQPQRRRPVAPNIVASLIALLVVLAAIYLLLR